MCISILSLPRRQGDFYRTFSDTIVYKLSFSSIITSVWEWYFFTVFFSGLPCDDILLSSGWGDEINLPLFNRHHITHYRPRQFCHLGENSANQKKSLLFIWWKKSAHYINIPRIIAAILRWMFAKYLLRY